MSDPRHSSRLGRGGRGGVLSFEVTGPHGAAVVVALEHRDPGDAMWSAAGSFSVLAPAKAALPVSALKDEVRFRFDVVRNPGRDRVEVRARPPEWLSC